MVSQTAAMLRAIASESIVSLRPVTTEIGSTARAAAAASPAAVPNPRRTTT